MTSLADDTDLVAGVETRLREVGKVVRRAMLDAMPDGQPVQWLYGPMREYPSRPGKALRPALCLSAGRAFGAATDTLMGVAVAIELLHNAFLVHDDIADGSEMRRGRPTLAAKHGLAVSHGRTVAGGGLHIARLLPQVSTLAGQARLATALGATVGRLEGALRRIDR